MCMCMCMWMCMDVYIYIHYYHILYIYVSIYTSSSIYRWLSHENLHLVPGFPSHVSLPANPFFPTAPSATKARSRCMRSASPRLSFWSNCRIWNSDKESTSAANWFSAPMTAPRGSTGIRFGIRFGISETNHHMHSGTCSWWSLSVPLFAKLILGVQSIWPIRNLQLELAGDP